MLAKSYWTHDNYVSHFTKSSSISNTLCLQLVFSHVGINQHRVKQQVRSHLNDEANHNARHMLDKWLHSILWSHIKVFVKTLRERSRARTILRVLPWQQQPSFFFFFFCSFFSSSSFHHHHHHTLVILLRVQTHIYKHCRNKFKLAHIRGARASINTLISIPTIYIVHEPPTIIQAASLRGISKRVWHF